MRFRGREVAHNELGLKLLGRLQNDVTEHATIEQAPRFEGWQLVMHSPECGLFSCEGMIQLHPFGGMSYGCKFVLAIGPCKPAAFIGERLQADLVTAF